MDKNRLAGGLLTAVGILAWRVARAFFGAAKLLFNPATLRDMAISWLGGRIGK